MPITGIYTKDFPDLGRDAGATDLIPIAEVGNIVTKKIPVSGLITNARVVGALGFTPYNATNPSGYITEAQARSAHSFVAGSGAYNSSTGVITIPTNTNQLTNGAGFITSSGLSGYVPTSRTLTINGTTFDLSANRSWTISANVDPLFLDPVAKVVTNQGAGSSPTGSTSFGGGALVNNTTGYFNTAYGLNALGNNNEGTENVAVGVNSVGGFSSTSNPVYRNTGIGTLALSNLQSSSDNVAVGYRSGLGDAMVHGIDFTTINNSVFIGSETRPLANNQTNQIVIGFNAIGAGSNTATLGNESITITRLRGEVRGGSFVKDGGTSSQFLKADGSVDSNSYLPLSGGTLASSGSANTLNINHTSGSGIALNILKDGNGEALTIVKGSGSGNAASITGGITLLSELNLTTKLADAHIASAATWNAKIGGSGTTNYLAKFTASGVVGNSVLQEVSGNLGLGVTPSAWDSGQKVYQSGLGSFYGLADGGATIVVNNGYYNAGWKYSSNSSAGVYQIVQNSHQWLTAPSGTAGNVISFTQAMTLGANGNVLIGTTTDAGFKLDVNGSLRANTRVNFASLPTSATGLVSGDLWRNGTVINIVA
jgi:hypothetical protein